MNNLVATTSVALLLCAGSVSANTACDANDVLTIISATDDGLYEETHGPDNLIDGDLEADSRWSNQSQGEPKTVLFDLGAVQTLNSFSIAWHKGNSRWSEFSLEASKDGKKFNEIVPLKQSSGTTLALENHDFKDLQAQFIKLVGNGNESNHWNSIVEVVAYGCGVPVAKPAAPLITERKGEGIFGLHTDQPPSNNFDLSGWYITTPADDDGNGKSDNVFENELVAGWTDPRFFYTDPATGGMVFRSTPAGAKTSNKTKYTRTELRGMLRKGDYNIETRLEGGIPNKNNWVFSSAPKSAQALSGGVDGVLNATLSVNQVTRLGKAYQVGRVIIGQIHAKDDEPIRLYYRKLPKNKFGSIYFAHEPATGKETWVEIIGSRGDRAENPENGIALDELFSYVIEVKGKPEGGKIIPMLHVKIIRDDGTEVDAEPYDMRASGFNVEDDFMFFKAGAYSQNNTSPEPETDFDKIIFYKLDYSHSPAPEPEEGVTVSVSKKVESNSATAVEGVVIDDSFADGDYKGGTDRFGANWLSTTGGTAFEISEGSLGLVSGGSGRGFRNTFAPQTLIIGQTLKASFTFTTPATIGNNRDSSLRVGFYNKLERAELEGDVSASSKKPVAAFDGLPGYMLDFDVALKDPTLANIDIRKHKDDTQGRLLGTTKGYQHLGGGGEAYQFVPEKRYTGTISLKKMANGMEVSGSLSQGASLLSQFSLVDEGSDVNHIGMLAFHVNSKTFGSSKKKDTPDNGIDFSNVKIEVLE